MKQTTLLTVPERQEVLEWSFLLIYRFFTGIMEKKDAVYRADEKR